MPLQAEALEIEEPRDVGSIRRAGDSDEDLLNGEEAKGPHRKPSQDSPSRKSEF